MTVGEFVTLLEARGLKGHRRGKEFRYQCPAHGGGDCNLAISEGEGGRVLVVCHSHHCSFEAIARSAGVEPAELCGALRQVNGAGLGHGERAYPYRDEQGNLLFEVVRREPKGFTQRRPDPVRPGEWVWKLDSTRRVLFGLPELLKTAPGDVIAITEGEKDAVAVAALGITATTNPHGARRWRQEYTDWLVQHLPDRRFLICADYDEEGTKHAEEVYAGLKQAGLEVYCADLPGLPPKGDVSDWIKAGGTAEQLRAMAAPKPPRLWPRLLTFEQLLAQPSPAWLIDGLFMEQTMVEFYGPPNEGKTFVVVDACMALRRGGLWCGHSIDITGPILYVSADGGLGFADRGRAWAIIGGRLAGEEEFWTFPEPINLYRSDTVAELRAMIAFMPKKPKVLVIDTYSRCIPGVNENQQEFASMVVDHLTSLMREFGLSTWLLHHTDKTGLHDRGSSVILGACDTQIRVSKSAENVITLKCEKQRDAPFFDPIYMDLGRVPGTNETWVTWRIDGPPPGRDDRIEAARERIKQAVAETPGITRAVLYAVLDLPESTLRRYLLQLLEEGAVIEHELPRQPGQLGPPQKGLFGAHR